MLDIIQVYNSFALSVKDMESRGMHRNCGCGAFAYPPWESNTKKETVEGEGPGELDVVHSLDVRELTDSRKRHLQAGLEANAREHHAVSGQQIVA